MKTIHSLFVLMLLLITSCEESTKTSNSDQQYKKGENLYDRAEYNQAFTYFYDAYQGYTHEKRYGDAAYSLIFLAIIQTEKGDFLGSNENLTKAAQFSTNNKVLLTSIYNQFAINHNHLKNNKDAIYWYQKALPLTTHTYSKLSIRNNIAISHLQMGNYSEAKNILRNIAKNPVIKDSIDFRNRVLDNLAYSKFLSGDIKTSGVEMLNVLQSRKNRNDRFGITASLSHLADFYSLIDQKRSREFAEAMYQNSLKTGNIDDQIEALEKIIDSDEEAKIKPLFKKYRVLNDSIENSKNNSKNQFTSIIYESEKNKADILDSRNHILKQRISILALIAFLVIAVLWFAQWRKQQAYQKEIAVKDTQIKYAKKVHDVVANGLYHVMVEIENQPHLNRQSVLNSIEKLYEESRDIAREDLGTIDWKDFSVRLYDMLDSYSSDANRVIIIGNTPEIWSHLSGEIQMEIYYVLRELLINMKKHSEAKFTSLKFEKSEQNITIKYTDNGIGMDILNIQRKSGIQNMENRIEKLGGKFNFEPNPKGGLITNILIPNN